MAGRAEPKKLLGRAGGSGQPFWVHLGVFGGEYSGSLERGGKEPDQDTPKSWPGHFRAWLGGSSWGRDVAECEGREEQQGSAESPGTWS